MKYVFSKTSIGYSHLRAKALCEDYSSMYQDKDRIIISCCDGHGGKKYIRSHIGSKIASKAILNIFSNIDNSLFKLKEEEIENKIKLEVLCEWNKLIEQQTSHKHFTKKELASLSEEDILDIKANQAKAYGTTLTGALLLNNKLLVIKIGDTECLGISKGELVKIFDDTDEPAANITYSMCQDDAFKHLKVKVLDFKNLDGLILCTDGLTNPYQSYDNFTNSFIKPTINNIINTNSLNELDTFIDEVASKLGVGDDVSISLILKDKLNKKYYR